jgi:hypothetical protein
MIFVCRGVRWMGSEFRQRRDRDGSIAFSASQEDAR